MLENMIAIPAFNDNYIWVYLDKINNKALVIDPGDADPVIAKLATLQVEISSILLTHHHHDHSGGIKKLLEQGNNISVIGSTLSPCELLTRRVKEGEDIAFGSFLLKVLEIPGHTLDHLGYFNNTVLFSGDTLFSAGCGRVFEGTYEQMYRSLTKISQLADSIHIFCGHEYTLSNLQFAKKVEPHNNAIDEKIKSAEELRKNNLPTLPSSLGIEKQINPFLRCMIPTVISAAENHAQQKLQGPAEVFKVLREWKNKG